jgi:hypothetical protein
MAFFPIAGKIFHILIASDSSGQESGPRVVN